MQIANDQQADHVASRHRQGRPNWEVRLCACVVALVIGSGCAITDQVAGLDFTPPTGPYRLLVIEPDVSVARVMAGGGLEPREDWTQQAREQVLNAIVAQQARRGGQTKVAETVADVGGDTQAVADLIRLHNAVGEAIRVHEYGGVKLPAKGDAFDWTLGSSAVELGRLTGFDYALFVHAQDSFSSGGRIALQVASVIPCSLGFCFIPQGGEQLAYASLVDLATGQIVWFNSLRDTMGDLRTQEGAEDMIGALLGRMKPGSG